MPKAAEEVHGLTDRIPVRQEFICRWCRESYCKFLGDAKLVAHNAQFDFNFLNAELRTLRPSRRISQFRMVDTLAIAKSKHPGAKLSLDALCVVAMELIAVTE